MRHLRDSVLHLDLIAAGLQVFRSTFKRADVARRLVDRRVLLDSHGPIDDTLDPDAHDYDYDYDYDEHNRYRDDHVHAASSINERRSS